MDALILGSGIGVVAVLLKEDARASKREREQLKLALDRVQTLH
jgi:hypothetical protein